MECILHAVGVGKDTVVRFGLDKSRAAAMMASRAAVTKACGVSIRRRRLPLAERRFAASVLSPYSTPAVQCYFEIFDIK